MLRQATWIRASWEPQPDEYTDFLLSFAVTEGKRYELLLACDTDYALYEGDKLLAFGQYPDYPERRVYDTLFLDALATGEHRLLLRVWYQGLDSQTAIRKESGVIFVLTEEGVPILLSSPEIPSRVAGGYVPHLCRRITPQLGYSFAYDFARPCGAFAPSIVAPIDCLPISRPIAKLTLADRVSSTIVQSGSYCVREGKTLGEYQQKAALTVDTVHATLDGSAAVTLKSTEEGIYVIVDMGRETAGLLDLSFVCKRPCRVVGGWGEHLTDGRCRTAVRDFSFELFAVEGQNELLHPFRRFGGRYLQLFFEIEEVTVFYLGIRETFYPMTLKWKPSGDLLRDRISEVCINTLRQCMHEHYEDCPWREQALYTLDSRNQMLCGYTVFEETDFARASLDLISQGLREDGLLSICYPSGLDVPIPSFSLAYFIQMREYLEHTGDRVFLTEKYPFLQKLISTFLDRRNVLGLVPNFNGEEHWNFYEWQDGLFGDNAGGLVKAHDAIDAPLNAFLSLALQSLATIADRLGSAEDAVTYRGIALAINDALKTHFYNPKVGLFRSFFNRRQEEYSVLTNSLCLLCGAADGLDKEVMLTLLSTNGDTNFGQKVIPNTLSMNAFRFDALLREDQECFGSVILAEIDRVYLYMLEHGATSFWETFLGESDFDGAGSLCHGWTALPLHYYATLL